VVPTPQGVQARVADVRFQLWLERGHVAQGVIEGVDLFTRWAEAIEMRVLDPAVPTDRAAVSSSVSDVLSGALEATLPAARCTPRVAAPAGGGEILLARHCDGWDVVARMADRESEPDAIEVRGPQP
jgi:hypothetical protein